MMTWSDKYQLNKSATLLILSPATQFLSKQMDEAKPPALDPENWKSMKTFIEHYGVMTDSLWLLGERDDSGAHTELHHGGFIPQIPRQAILRFTKPYETVIDGFSGYGTTLIECRRWGRNGLGIEIDRDICQIGIDKINKEPSRYNVKTTQVRGDSASIDLQSLLQETGLERATLAVLHPPYHDIIIYGEDDSNLCNAPSLKSFRERYSDIVENIQQALKPDAYLQLVIGDKYEKGEWVPLGFYLMEETIKKGFKLKSICVKNIENTLAKRNRIHLWKYRALKSGFYFFKHEYIMFFKQ
jgi:hypothetical protein